MTDILPGIICPNDQSFLPSVKIKHMSSIFCNLGLISVFPYVRGFHAEERERFPGGTCHAFGSEISLAYGGVRLGLKFHLHTGVCVPCFWV